MSMALSVRTMFHLTKHIHSDTVLSSRVHAMGTKRHSFVSKPETNHKALALF